MSGGGTMRLLGGESDGGGCAGWHRRPLALRFEYVE
jgi:hypothetical protein